MLLLLPGLCNYVISHSRNKRACKSRMKIGENFVQGSELCEYFVLLSEMVEVDDEEQ